MFVERKKELSDEREKEKNSKTRKVKAKINIVIREVENELKEKGIDATEDEIMAEVIRRMNK